MVKRAVITGIYASDGSLSGRVIAGKRVEVHGSSGGSSSLNTQRLIIFIRPSTRLTTDPDLHLWRPDRQFSNLTRILREVKRRWV